MDSPPAQRVRAILPGGGAVWVEATAAGDDAGRNVAHDLSDALPLDDIGKVIAGIGALVQSGIAGLKPATTTAAFSLEIALQSGALTAVWVKGTANASITITLEWE